MLLGRSRWPAGWIFYREELPLRLLLLPELQPVGAGRFCAAREALHLHFVVLHELVCANILDGFAIENVLAHLFERFCDSSVDLNNRQEIHSLLCLIDEVTYVDQVLHQFLVDHVFMLERRQAKFLQVDGQILDVPAVLLDLA